MLLAKSMVDCFIILLPKGGFAPCNTPAAFLYSVVGTSVKECKCLKPLMKGRSAVSMSIWKGALGGHSFYIFSQIKICR